MLQRIADDKQLIQDDSYCQLVLTAWENVSEMFFSLYSSDRDNFLYGLKCQAEGPLNNVVHLLSPSGKRTWSKEYMEERVGWKDAAWYANRIEVGIMAEAEYLDEVRRCDTVLYSRSHTPTADAWRRHDESLRNAKLAIRKKYYPEQSP